MFKCWSCLEFLLKISVSQRQCLVSVSKFLAETPALEENSICDDDMATKIEFLQLCEMDVLKLI